jgi:site-specific recombinase XerD
MIALIDLYQKELLKVNGFSPATVETYLINLNAFFGFLKEVLHLPLDQVTGAHLMKWMRHLSHVGASASKMKSHHYSLKSFFGFLEKIGHVRKNPAEVLPQMGHLRSERTKPASAADVRRLLASFDCSEWHGVRNYTMVSILWALGLRTAELTGLRVGDFEPGHGKRIGLLRIRGKNKKQRALFVVGRLFDTITRYLAHPRAPKKKSAALFAGEKNGPISKSRVQRIVRDQGKAAGIAAITPRVLRHSFATEMYHQNIPLSAIQAMMGHASKAETSIYIHVSDKLKQVALEAVSISGRFLWE